MDSTFGSIHGMIEVKESESMHPFFRSSKKLSSNPFFHFPEDKKKEEKIDFLLFDDSKDWNIPFRKIKYLENALNGQNWFEGVLVKENLIFYYVIHPLAYIWAQKMNRMELLKQCKTIPLLKGNTIMQNVESFWFERQEIDWIFKFPITDSVSPHFSFICIFLEWFFITEGSLTKRIETAIEYMAPFLPESVIASLVQFIFQHYQNDPDRIKFILSPKIFPYLYGNYKK